MKQVGSHPAQTHTMLLVIFPAGKLSLRECPSWLEPFSSFLRILPPHVPTTHLEQLTANDKQTPSLALE